MNRYPGNHLLKHFHFLFSICFFGIPFGVHVIFGSIFIYFWSEIKASGDKRYLNRSAKKTQSTVTFSKHAHVQGLLCVGVKETPLFVKSVLTKNGANFHVFRKISIKKGFRKISFCFPPSLKLICVYHFNTVEISHFLAT